MLNPKIDYVFKRIFGYVGNEEITAELLKAILKNKVTNVKLDNNPILEKDLLDDKVGILDIKAKINDNINCNIEMQIVDKHNIEKRILYYWSKMYTRGIKAGEDYNKLEKCIIILFIDYELENIKNIEKYLTKWSLREEEYTKNILTEDLEICIIEIPKFKKKQEGNQLDSWLEFIQSPEVLNMEKANKEIKKARQVLEEISQDEHEIALAELRQKYIMDQKAVEDSGFYKGLKQGKKDTVMDIAKKMKNKGIGFNIISEITGLTKEEVENI